MLAEIEQSLVAYLQASPLAARLRRIEALPDLDGESLVSKFGADAPAVYVAVGSGSMQDGMASITVGIACVARNSRSPQAARQGDGMQIGVLQLVHEVIKLIHDTYIEEFGYLVSGWDPVDSDALTRKGLYAAVVQARTEGYYGT
jgi:phage gp37-like protein